MSDFRVFRHVSSGEITYLGERYRSEKLDPFDGRMVEVNAGIEPGKLHISRRGKLIVVLDNSHLVLHKDIYRRQHDTHTI